MSVYSDIPWKNIDGRYQKGNPSRYMDKTASLQNGFTGSGSNPKPVITTKGWKIKLKWEDGTVDWLEIYLIKHFTFATQSWQQAKSICILYSKREKSMGRIIIYLLDFCPM